MVGLELLPERHARATAALAEATELGLVDPTEAARIQVRLHVRLSRRKWCKKSIFVSAVFFSFFKT